MKEGKADLRKVSILKASLLLTVIFEGLTLISRFMLKMESTRDTGFLQNFTFGIRIHHSYFGLCLLLLIMFKRDLFGKYAKWVIALSIALILSDLIHHFLILWPITGSHDFDLVYPEP